MRYLALAVCLFAAAVIFLSSAHQGLQDPVVAVQPYVAAPATN